MEKLSLSIITINLNNASGLEKTINSVRSQINKNFEYIIIDGNSSDESIQIIKDNKDIINFSSSETDNGIYNAMNKGILKASGTHCLFLNSSDILVDSNVTNSVINSDVNADFIFCNTFVEIGNKKELVSPPPSISFYHFYTHTIIHQSYLTKVENFKKFGNFNENLQIVSDWEFAIKCLFLYNTTYQVLNLNLTVFDSTGFSSNKANYPIALKERSEVLNKYFSNFLPDYELIKEKAIYKYLKWINNKSLLLRLFILKARIINKLFN